MTKATVETVVGIPELKVGDHTRVEFINRGGSLEGYFSAYSPHSLTLDCERPGGMGLFCYRDMIEKIYRIQ